MFGWGEFREDGKHKEENKVENSVFHSLAKEGKLGGRKTRRKFSPGPTKFILSNCEENVGEKSAHTALLQKYPILESSKKKKNREREH